MPSLAEIEANPEGWEVLVFRALSRRRPIAYLTNHGPIAAIAAMRALRKHVRGCTYTLRARPAGSKQPYRKVQDA